MLFKDEFHRQAQLGLGTLAKTKDTGRGGEGIEEGDNNERKNKEFSFL